MAKKLKKTKRAWAVVTKRGKIVRHENGTGLLVFGAAWQAYAQRWLDGERVVPVTITFG